MPDEHCGIVRCCSATNHEGVFNIDLAADGRE
jgi:hypothetical protein